MTNLDQVMPHWMEHVAVYYTGAQIALTAVSTWLSQILPPPSEVNSQGYKLFYGTVERISLAGRRNWKATEQPKENA